MKGKEKIERKNAEEMQGKNVSIHDFQSTSVLKQCYLK